MALDYSALGKRISNFRNASGFTQEQLDLLTNERKMAFCMVYLLYQLQEVIFYDGKTKRTNPDGNP